MVTIALLAAEEDVSRSKGIIGRGSQIRLNCAPRAIGFSDDKSRCIIYGDLFVLREPFSPSAIATEPCGKTTRQKPGGRPVTLSLRETFGQSQ